MSEPKISKRGMRKKWLEGVAGVVAFPIILGVTLLPDYIESEFCSKSTFKMGNLNSGPGLIVSLFVDLFSTVVLCLAIISKISLGGGGLNHQSDPLIKKFSTKMIVISIIALVLTTVLRGNSEYYFCMDPMNIVIKTGYFYPPRQFGWDDIVSVSARCWTTKPAHGTAYKGSTLQLAFNTGDEIPFGLVSGGNFLGDDYAELITLLRFRKYQYYTEASVTPDSCPPGLYESLIKWQSN